MDGNESSPAPHGDAGTKAATGEDGKTNRVAEPAAPGGAPAPSEPAAGPTGTSPQPATAGEADRGPEPACGPDASDPAGRGPALHAIGNDRGTAPPRPTGPPAAPGARPGPGPDTVPAPGPRPTAPQSPSRRDLRPARSRVGSTGQRADRPLVLGGAAAAEGRTSGSHPRIAGPATAPGGTGDGDEGDDEPRGRHFLAAERDHRPVAPPARRGADPRPRPAHRRLGHRHRGAVGAGHAQRPGRGPRRWAGWARPRSPRSWTRSTPTSPPGPSSSPAATAATRRPRATSAWPSTPRPRPRPPSTPAAATRCSPARSHGSARSSAPARSTSSTR